MTCILGLNAYHGDYSACLVKDGVLVAAAEEALVVRAAHATAQGSVVGWFQGRMEWGPRALGNRSIVCDPRRADMKDIHQRQDQAS